MYGIFTPGVKISLIRGRHTKGRGFAIPWVEGSNNMHRGQHTMDRGFDIPWVKGSKYHVKEGQNTTVRGSIHYR
jgi:hypothetical protein